MNRNNLIDYARQLDISGVELTFSSKEDLFSFRLSPKNEAWLKTLEYVSIHAPFRLIMKSKNEGELLKQLNVIEQLYQQVGAKNVVVHPNELPSQEILGEYKFRVSTENMSKKHKVSVEKMRDILENYPRIGLCLDVAHAYRWSKNETMSLVESFGDRITQVHFSGTYKGKDHLSLRGVTRNFLSSIEPIGRLDVPIVIEEDIKTRSVAYLNKELELVRKILSGLEN